MTDPKEVPMVRRLSLAALVLLCAPAVFPQTAGEGSVPITTVSAEARAAYLEGRGLVERLRGQEARAHFERAVAADPDFALARLALAQNQPSAKGFFDELARAVALAPKVSEGERLMILAADAGGKGDNERATRLLEELVAKYPRDERALVLLGGAHFGAQRYPQAIAAYERAAAIAPGFSQIYNQLGYSYRFSDQPEKAEAPFRKYIEVLPGDPNPYDSYAELLLELGRYDEAIGSYRKALALRSDFVNSRFGIATALDLSGRGAEARRELDQVLAAARDDGDRRGALFAKTVSWVEEGNFAAAQAEVDKQYALGEAIGDELAMAGDLVLMGNLALETGHVQDAETRFRRALELVEGAPDVAPENKANQRRFARFNTARVELARGDLPRARDAANRFAKEVAASGNPFQKRLAHEIAGQIALAEKRWDDAIAELGQASQLDPYNRYRLSLAYEGKGDRAKAKQLADDARNDNTLTNLNLAFVRQKTKRRG
jgi:tetratricopeptide (TPR) repeat protein